MIKEGNDDIIKSITPKRTLKSNDGKQIMDFVIEFKVDKTGLWPHYEVAEDEYTSAFKQINCNRVVRAEYDIKTKDYNFYLFTDAYSKEESLFEPGSPSFTNIIEVNKRLRYSYETIINECVIPGYIMESLIKEFNVDEIDRYVGGENSVTYLGDYEFLIYIDSKKEIELRDYSNNNNYKVTFKGKELDSSCSIPNRIIGIEVPMYHIQKK